MKYSIFGESHGPAIGVVLEGVPPGLALDLDAVRFDLSRRAPGKNALSTPRREADEPRVLSGLFEGHTTGAPLCAVIENTDTRSGDYARTKDLARPGHADYAAHVRYGGFNDYRGGGHFSGRLTAPLVFAGGVAKQILAQKGVRVGAHISTIYGINDDALEDWESLRSCAAKDFPVLSDEKGAEMREAISEAKSQQDSVGGAIECGVFGLPPGLGDPMFDGVENRLAGALFGIPAVRGVSFGTGFAAAGMRGSVHNDPFIMEDGRVRTRTNHAGGVLGGITSGMPLVVNIAVKPTASISREQETVDLETKENSPLVIHGRHDPCIVPRAVPVAEAVTALMVLDMMLE